MSGPTWPDQPRWSARWGERATWEVAAKDSRPGRLAENQVTVGLPILCVGSRSRDFAILRFPPTSIGAVVYFLACPCQDKFCRLCSLPGWLAIRNRRRIAR